MVSAIKPADFGKRSLSRNPLIFGLFAKMQLVEQIGSGIVRMNDLMKVAGLSAPEFNTEGMFTITLQRPPKVVGKKQDPSEKTVEKTVEKTIIDLITENQKTTTKNMISATGLFRRGVEYHHSKKPFLNEK